VPESQLPCKLLAIFSRDALIRERHAFGTNEFAIRQPQPLDLRLGETCRQIRPGTTSDRTVHVLLLRAEDPAFELAKFSSLELGTRTTEAFDWLAKGKRNEEIGII